MKLKKTLNVQLLLIGGRQILNVSVVLFFVAKVHSFVFETKFIQFATCCRVESRVNLIIQRRVNYLRLALIMYVNKRPLYKAKKK